MDNIKLLLEKQRTAFQEGLFRAPARRQEALNALFQAVKRHETEIAKALYRDLGKCEFEARATEISVLLDEIVLLKRKLKTFAKPRRVPTSLLNFPSKGLIYPEPYGNTLIFSAWNYPFQLMLMPLIGAVAAGNTVIAKPAEQAPATAAVLEKILSEAFTPEHVAVVQGGRETACELLQERFDYIFYTGGPGGGKAVLKAAAEFMTPVTLELGGKSPCIVDADARLDLAARRIVWGKFLNAGQTCVAPDYILVHQSLREPLLERLNYYINRFYGADPSKSPDYPRIINESHFDRLLKLYPKADADREIRYIAPTVIADATPDAPVMTDEIFGPLLPVLAVQDLDEAIRFINGRPKPLALYYFGTSGRKRVLAETSSGGACINETVSHLINPSMPFGGVGPSGMGAYHGKWSFETFTHYKSVMEKSTGIDLPMRYPPNLSGKLKILKLLSR
jgi:aldehyde dehydrogenase (NAD+)